MGSKQINEFNISGKVVFVGRPVQISDNSFKRIIEMEVYVKNRYKQEVAFEFVNDNKSMLNFVKDRRKFGFFNYSGHLDKPQIGDQLKVEVSTFAEMDVGGL
jgi:hypothetical protein